MTKTYIYLIRYLKWTEFPLSFYIICHIKYFYTFPFFFFSEISEKNLLDSGLRFYIHKKCGRCPHLCPALCNTEIIWQPYYATQYSIWVNCVYNIQHGNLIKSQNAPFKNLNLHVIYKKCVRRLTFTCAVLILYAVYLDDCKHTIAMSNLTYMTRHHA